MIELTQYINTLLPHRHVQFRKHRAAGELGR